jgi:hypothetical protein
MKTLYERIDINGDESKLPKETEIGTFIFVFNKRMVGGLDVKLWNPDDKKLWLDNYDWYLQPCTDKRDELIEKAVNGLNEAKKLIRGWHGMGMQAIPEAEMWNIYNKQSPEMKRLNELIALLEKEITGK